VLNPGNLSFSFVGGTAGAADNEFTGFDAFQAGGDGFFDISFDYTESTTGDRFTSGEAATYEISYISPIDVTSFDFFSSIGGGQVSYLAAAKNQGIAHANCSAEDPTVKADGLESFPNL
jgi:hypothetical protein